MWWADSWKSKFKRDGDKPVAVFRHRGVDGETLNQDTVGAE